jgi:hypothetical protein
LTKEQHKERRRLVGAARLLTGECESAASGAPAVVGATQMHGRRQRWRGCSFPQEERRGEPIAAPVDDGILS